MNVRGRIWMKQAWQQQLAVGEPVALGLHFTEQFRRTQVSGWRTCSRSKRTDRPAAVPQAAARQGTPAVA